MLMVAFSWFVLGIKYGIGYCPVTQWHWEVRSILDRPVEAHSYIQFMIDRFMGISLDERYVGAGTLVIFALLLSLSILLNRKYYRPET